MGPLELLDQVGLDVALHVAGSLDGVLPGVARRDRKVVGRWSRQGQLGKKSFAASTSTTKGKRRGPATLGMLDVPGITGCRGNDFADDSLTTIQRRLIYPMLAEAVRCHEEGIVSSAGPSTWQWCWEPASLRIAVDRCT